MSEKNELEKKETKFQKFKNWCENHKYEIAIGGITISSAFIGYILGEKHIVGKYINNNSKVDYYIEDGKFKTQMYRKNAFGQYKPTIWTNIDENPSKFASDIAEIARKNGYYSPSTIYIDPTKVSSNKEQK